MIWGIRLGKNRPSFILSFSFFKETNQKGENNDLQNRMYPILPGNGTFVRTALKD
jgi:hypothetical protein